MSSRVLHIRLRNLYFISKMTGEPHIPETFKIFLGVSSLEANKPMKGLEL